jgi:hypothetical protein
VQKLFVEQLIKTTSYPEMFRITMEEIFFHKNERSKMMCFQMVLVLSSVGIL